MEAEREARVEQQYLQRMREEQQQLRWQAVELCRKNLYNEAATLFVPMTAAREAQFSRWAEHKQECINLAENAFTLVYNTREKLEDVKFSVQNRPGRSRIQYIGRRSIDVAFITFEYIGDQQIEKITDRIKIDLDDVTPPQMWELCRVSASKDDIDEATLDLWFGCYLLARGQFLGESRKRFNASGMSDRVNPFLDELETMEPLIRERQWEDYLDRLKLLVAQGELQSARRFARLLKNRYPGEYEEREAEIAAILQED